MDNHVIANLENRALALVGPTGRVGLQPDAHTLEFLKTCLQAMAKPGRHQALLPSTRSQLPVFIATACAWDLQTSVDPAVVVLVTRQADALSIANAQSFPRSVWSPSGRHNMLNVAIITDRAQNIGKAVSHKWYDTPPRLVITPRLSNDIIEGLEPLRVQRVIIDGRSINLEDVELEPATRALHLAVSRLQARPGWELLPAIAPAGTEEGPLCSPIVPFTGAQGCRVADACPTAWPVLARLQRRRRADLFAAEARNLAWTLSALTVPPSALDPQFVPSTGRRANAVYAPLELLEALAATAGDPAEAADMAEFVHEARLACRQIDAGCPKGAKVAELARSHPGSIIIVRGRSNKDALQRLLREASVDARVALWRDPVDWMPHQGSVIIAGAPPSDRFWLLTPHSGLGRDVHFVLTPPEVQSMRRSIARHVPNAKKDGPIMLALAEIESPESAAEAEPKLPINLMDWLDSQQIGPSAPTATGVTTGMQMQCISLRDGGRYYVGITTKVPVFGPEGLNEVFAAELQPGNVILVPRRQTGGDLVETVLLALEDQEPDHRLAIKAWKDEVRAKAKELNIDNPELLCSHLRGMGAVRISPTNIRLSFYEDELIAPQDEHSVLRATAALLQRPLDVHELGEHIRRVRGIRRSGGRFVHQYARMSYISDEEHLKQRFYDDYGLTHQEVQSLVKPAIVSAVSPPLPSPRDRINYLSENVNA